MLQSITGAWPLEGGGVIRVWLRSDVVHHGHIRDNNIVGKFRTVFTTGIQPFVNSCVQRQFHAHTMNETQLKVPILSVDGSYLGSLSHF